MMTSPSVSLRLRSLALLLSLGALALGGCHQDLGERCEQGSDCASGYCGGSQLGMTSAMGATCTPGPGTVIYDAAPIDTSTTTNDAGAEAGDAKSDLAAEAGAETGDAQGEAGDGATNGDGASEAGPDGAEAGASEAGTDAAADAGASDAGATEAGAG